MHTPHPRSASPRRLLFLGSAFLLSMLSCGREPTGPAGPAGIRWSHAIAFNAEFPAGFAEYQKSLKASPQSTPTGAGSVVTFTRVRILLHFPDGSVALDQMVDFPAGVDEVPVTLNVPLPAGAPAGGVPLSMSLAYQNAAGETVFRGGPVTVVAVPAAPGQGPPPPSPVTVPLQYTGPGATTATDVRISPRSLTVNTGAPFAFSAQAHDAAGNVIGGVPILFSSQSPALANINTVTGAGTAGASRGTVQIEAKLLTGPVDIAVLTIAAPASTLTAVSGGAQTANVNATLAQPVVVQANATDGAPAPGVTVAFAAQNGGSVGSASVVTGADGRASTTWRLGPSAGTQTLSATAPGLAGSPISFSATARSIDPVRIQFVQQPPASAAAGRSIAPAITLQAVDATNAATSGFTGTVAIALGAGAPAGAVLTGTTSVTAVGGVATFANLSINLPGTYTLVATSGTLTGATSNSFQVVAGDAQRLVFQEYPVGSAVAGSVLSTVRVATRDALGNPNTTFAGPVTLSANGPTNIASANTGEPASATDTASTSGSNADVVMTGPITVNAVGGVATFANIQLNGAGSYTFTATSPGLTSVTGLSFTITPGAASVLELVSGGGQSAAGSSALANPIVVKVTDAFGNGIAGKSLTFTPTAGSGTATPTTAVTTAGGLAQTSWTIGPVAGPMTLQVSGTSLAPNPLVVSASALTTAGPGPATQLVFTTQPTNRAAGLPLLPAVVVTARDALGATATGFTGLVTVSILNNVGSSTLLGTTAVNAVAGVATFNNLSLTNVGTGYTLQATSGALTAAASSAFNITPSGANSILVQSGNTQSGTVGTLLPAKLIARVIDAFGNAVPGVSVTWAVTAGGGTLSATTSTTDANGRVETDLTLGPTAGTNTVTVTSSGLTGSPLTFTAAAVPGAVTQLVFTGQPTNTTANAFTPTIVVEARDAANNLVTGFTGGVNIQVSTNPNGAAVYNGVTGVSAVGGVATFTGGVQIIKAGIGYTLTATSSGIPNGTSAAFNVAAGPALLIFADSGDGQTAIASTPVTNKLVGRITDQYANPVAGHTTVWSVTGGGGLLTATTNVTDANGRVRTSWTLGAAAGTQTVLLDGINPSVGTIGFSATALAGTATQLIVTAQPQATQTAGTSGTAIVVTAKDASNNVATGFTGTVAMAIATGPAGATIIGPTSVTAAAGVATFGGVSFDKAGAYTLSFTAAGPLTVASGGFSVSAGAANVLSLVSGNNQSALGSAAVAAPLVAKVADTFGNPVAGVAGTWAVASGGGSLNATVSTSNAAGEFSTGWTLGPTAGPAHSVTLTVASVTTGSPLTFNAAATSALGNKVWTGANGTGLTDPANWSPPGAPIATDELVIQAGGPIPTLSANATFAKVTIAPTATLNLAGFTLTITGSLDAGTTITGAGSVNLTGTGTMKGKVVSDVVVTGTYSLAGLDSIVGNLTVSSAGQITLAGNTLAVTGNLSVTGVGAINMTNVADVMFVDGNASFGGSSGTMSAGVLVIRGNFTQTGAANSFAPTAGHVTQFFGGAPQSITFSDLTGVSSFNRLQIVNAGTTTIATDIRATSIDLNVAVGSFAGAGRTAIVRDSITDPNNRWAVSNARFTGPNIKIGNVLGSATVRVGPNVTNLLTNVSLAGSIVVDSGGTLVLNGKTLAIAGNFSTLTGGRLNMTNAADLLDVAGNATFGGGAQTGLLTAGSMQIGGDLVQLNNGTATSLVAAQTHSIVLDGAGAQTITLADADTIGGSCLKSCIGSMSVSKSGGSVTFGSPAKFTGDLTIGGTLTAFDAIGTAGNPRHVGVVGTFTSSAAAPVHITHLGLGGVYAKGAATIVDTITFAGTGQSIPAGGYGEVRVRGTATLSGAITTTGGLTVTGGSLTINGHTATVQGAFATTGTGALIMTGAADVLDVTGTTTFSGLPGTLSNGAILARGNFQQSSTSNAFSATGPHITRFVGTGNQAISLATPDQDPNPPNAGNACTASCFANVEVNKTTGRLDFGTHAKVMGAFTVVAQSDSLVANNKRLIVGGNLTPATAPTRLTLLSLGGTAPVAPTVTIDTLVYWGNTTIAKLPTVDLQVWGTSVIDASGTLLGGLRVFGSGTIAFNAQLFTINGDFSTNGTATFLHGADIDTVRVLGNVSLAGGVSVPSMGRLEVHGNLAIGTQPLIASGTHVTALLGSGAGTQTLNWGAAFVTQGFRHLHFGGSKAKVVVGTPKVFGNVELYSSLTQPITGAGATVNIGGNLTDSSWVSGDVTGNWRVENTGLFGTSLLRVGYMQTNLQITGTVQFPALPQLREGSASVQLANSLAFHGVTRVTGTVTVSGASGLLDLSASVLQVYGNFLTAGGGRLESNHNVDYLYVTGSATFAGGTSILTDGTLEVLGNFTQSATATAFTADTSHYTTIGAYTVIEEVQFRELTRARTRTPTPAQQTALAAGRERHLARRRILESRRAAARAAGRATGHTFGGAGLREVAPGVQRLSNLVSASAITFAHAGSGAGASHFGTWEITENVVIASDVVAGIITTEGGQSSMVTGTNHLVTSISASVDNLTFTNVRWSLDLKVEPGSLDNVTFTGMNTSAEQFTVQGDGTINPTLSGWQFVTVPGTGKYMRATDTTPGTTPFFVSVATIQPAGHGGKIVLVGDAGTDWPNVAVATWTNPNESNDWDDPTAWDIGVVPDQSVDVVIPASSSSWPTLNGNRSVRNLTVQDDGEGAGNIDLNDHTLLVYGDINVPTGFGSIFSCGEGGDGTIEVRSATASIEGRFCTLTIAAGAVATLTGDSKADRDVLVLGNLVLGEWGLEVDVNRTFSTAGSGTLTMTNASGSLDVYDAVFGGGSTAGLLTAGRVTVDGSLVVTAANAYAASGMHVTKLDASARLVGLRESALRAEAAARNQRRATMLRNQASMRSARVAQAAARLRRAGQTAAVRQPAVRSVGARPVNIEANYVDVAFTAQTGNQFGRLELNDYVNITTPVMVAKSAHLSDNAYVEGTGGMTVTDTLYGHQYSSLYTATTKLLGTLLDSGSYSPDTTIWAGVNQDIPAIIQGGYSYLSYNTVLVSGTGARMFNPTDYFNINNDLKVIGSGQLRVGDAGGNTTVYVYGNFATEGSGTLRMSDHDSTWVKVYGDTVTFGGGSTEGLLNKGELYVGGKLFQIGDAKAFAADKGHRTAFGGSSHEVTFVNPGFTASRFGDLVIEDDALLFNTDAFIAGSLLAQSDGFGVVESSNALITSRGAKATRLRFNNTRWKIVPGDSIESMTQVEFTAMDPTSTYFTLERNGSGVLPTFADWTFTTTPTGAGRYAELTDLLLNLDTLIVTMSSPTPSVHFNKVTLNGGARFAGWTSGTATAIGSGNWTSAGIWSDGVRPDSTKHIVIPTGVTVTLDTIVQHVRSLTTEGTGVLAQGSNSVYVHGSISADTLGGITCSTGITYQPDEVIGTVSGRFCRYHSGGIITLAGKMKVDSVWHVHDGTFNFNGKRVDTKQAWVGSGESGFGTGRIVMNNASDSLVVTDSMLVGDASNVASAGSAPTNGFISIAGNFRVLGTNGKNYFSPSALNKVRLAGTGEVFFSDTTASAVNRLEVLGTRTFASVVRVNGDLRNGGTIAGSNGRVRMAYGANFTGSVGSAVTVRAFELTGTFADSGGFSPDTVVFKGGPTSPQVIPDSVGVSSNINYKSIRIMNDATLLPKSTNSSWLINGKLLVDDAILRVGGGTTTSLTIADSLHIYSSGRLQMIDAASSVTVQGHARFAGSAQSGYLTAGTLTLLKNFAQTTSATSFVATGTHTTVFAGTTDSVSFANPANSKFHNVHVTAGSTIVLGSSMSAAGTLSRVGGASAVTLMGIAGNVQNFAVGGLSISGNPTTMNSVSIELQDGTASTTFNDITFTGYNAYTGAVFNVNRSGGQSYTFTNLNFGTVLSNLGSGGRLLQNTLNSTVTMAAATPGTGTLGTHYSNPGGGTVNWP